MSLNLAALGKQVRVMSQTVAREARQRDQRLDEVRQRYLAGVGQEDTWHTAVELSSPSFNWLLADPVEALDTVGDLPPIPNDYAIVATDGSHLDVDR
ncbi:MAG: hypothetical protein C0184_16420, partial [Chloroflexus aggregans]